ncbi:hypothetical protein FHG87_022303 [Trinorchestia longiramus]|nr:hypothetical protein FHG87_022303 [Trinorchestia longiramus]
MLQHACDVLHTRVTRYNTRVTCYNTCVTCYNTEVLSCNCCCSLSLLLQSVSVAAVCLCCCSLSLLLQSVSIAAVCLCCCSLSLLLQSVSVAAVCLYCLMLLMFDQYCLYTDNALSGVFTDNALSGVFTDNALSGSISLSLQVPSHFHSRFRLTFTPGFVSLSLFFPSHFLSTFYLTFSFTLHDITSIIFMPLSLLIPFLFRLEVRCDFQAASVSLSSEFARPAPDIPPQIRYQFQPIFRPIFHPCCLSVPRASLTIAPKSGGGPQFPDSRSYWESAAGMGTAVRDWRSGKMW